MTAKRKTFGDRVAALRIKYRNDVASCNRKNAAILTKTRNGKISEEKGYRERKREDMMLDRKINDTRKKLERLVEKSPNKFKQWAARAKNNYDLRKIAIEKGIIRPEDIPYRDGQYTKNKRAPFV